MIQAIASVSLIELKQDLSCEEVLCIDGIAEGQIYRQLRSWLAKEPNRFLVFVEEDAEKLDLAKGESWGQDPKVRLLCSQEDEAFKEIAWEFLFLKFSYVTNRPEQMQSVFAKIEYYHRAVDLIGADYRDMGVAVTRNMVANAERWPFAKMGQSLKGAFHQIPAVICGGGESLLKQIEALEALSDQALIFAGGSAMNRLAASAVRPHFAVHFDPDPPNSGFLEQEATEVPLLYQNRFASSLLHKAHGPALWMAEGGNYPIEKWLKEVYQIEVEPFDSGWTAVNFCAASALLMGCDPIIFVGMELSSKKPLQGLDMTVVDVEGGTCYTRKDWLMSGEWLETIAAAHPERSFINATEGGIGALPRLSLDEVIQAHCNRSWDLLGMVHAALQSAQPILAQEGVPVGELLRRSYQRVHEACDRLLALWEKSYPQSPLDQGEYALGLVDLEQEIAYRFVLEPMWQIWRRPILRTEKHPLGAHLHRLLFFKRAITGYEKEISS